jgi:hypothetical protein
MISTAAKLAATRRFAPPLVTTGRVDRRGANMRLLNRRAVDYARNAGFGVEDVYPDAVGTMRALAPPMGSPEAGAFVRAAGLSFRDVYPPLISCVGGDKALGLRRPSRWRWATVGFFVGAVIAGPIGAAVGVTVGLIGGGR